jgi:hypothetical protein
LGAVLGFLFGVVAFRKSDDTFWPHWDEPGNPGERLGHYPTDFTRNVLPVPCHSHNDYWRRIPLFEAVHAGCTSVEADVWLLGDDLFVGHEESALTSNRTFRALYLDPLEQILDRVNPTTTSGKRSDHGVFDEDSNQTLVLLVDFKTDGVPTFPFVWEQLDRLRQKGYLSHFDGKSFVERQITVVGTGNTPFDLVIANSTYRDIFFDAPLQQFSFNAPTATAERYNSTNSYFASTSLNQSIGFPWTGKYSKKQVEKIRDQIKAAQRAGLKTRYWDFPGWPVSLRNYVWGLLVQQGIDYLNVDDIKSATHGTWGKWG